MDASPKLKRLTIGLDGRTIDSNWWVFSAIPALGSPMLRSIAFRAKVNEDNVETRLDWKELERIVVDEMGLKKLRFRNFELE